MAITRRTRNAFVGSSRHKGSNPFISVEKCSPQVTCPISLVDFLSVGSPAAEAGYGGVAGAAGLC